MSIGTKNHPHLNLLVVSWPFASSSSSANKTTRPSVSSSSTAKTSAPFGQNRRTKANNSVCLLFALNAGPGYFILVSSLREHRAHILLWALSHYSSPSWFTWTVDLLISGQNSNISGPSRLFKCVNSSRGHLDHNIIIIITLWCGWLFGVGSGILIAYYFHPFTVNFRISMWKWKGVLSAQKAPTSFTWRRLLMGSS